jgi:auxin influx carrier (AUX1 LAX family)
MLPQKQAEEAMVSSFNLTERDDREEEKADEPGFGLKSILWHGGSVYDAWFSCASNQVLKQKHS